MMFGLLRRRTPFSIEILRVEHAGDCAEIHGQSFSHPWPRHEFEALIASESVFGSAAIAESGAGRTIGFSLARKAADEAEILTIAVGKSHRRLGVGGELLRHQAEELRRRGVRKIFLEVEESNQAARALYARHGYAQVGLRPGYYRTPAGAPANALLLACEMA